MYQGQSTFSQVMSSLPQNNFRQCVNRYNGNYRVRSFTSFIWITDGKVHDVNVLNQLIPEPEAIYIMDRTYLDFYRLYQLDQNSAVFVIRAKKNTGLRRIYSHRVDKTTGVKFDQTVALSGF